MAELVLFVLDLERGEPVEGMAVSVARECGEGDFAELHKGTTGADGCLRLPVSKKSHPCCFRVEYQSGKYAQDRHPAPTFPEICVQFTWDCVEKLVLPLLFTAHGYTTYRGN